MQSCRHRRVPGSHPVMSRLYRARALHEVEDFLQHCRLYLRLVLGSQRRRILRRGRRGSLAELASWRCLGVAPRLLLRCQLPIGGPALFSTIGHRTVTVCSTRVRDTPPQCFVVCMRQPAPASGIRLHFWESTDEEKKSWEATIYVERFLFQYPDMNAQFMVTSRCWRPSVWPSEMKTKKMGNTCCTVVWNCTLLCTGAQSRRRKKDWARPEGIGEEPMTM